MLGSLGKHTFEAHVGYLITYLIAIDERRVAEHSTSCQSTPLSWCTGASPQLEAILLDE